jgi:hypothetical protein
MQYTRLLTGLGWRVVVAGVFLLAGGVASAAELPLAIPAGARVGIIDMMPPDVTHFHIGATAVKSFQRTYRAAWTTADVIDEPLIWSLTNAGLEPVALQASDLLRRQKGDWIVKNPKAGKLPRACLEEMQRVMEENKLSAVIMIAPGPNVDPETVEGDRLKKLPDYIQGWGFSTSDEPGGLTKPVVFNFTQMLLVGKTTDGVRLEHREWGGSYIYDWPNFTVPPDVKAIPDTEVAKLRPVITDVMKRQIARLVPHLQP